MNKNENTKGDTPGKGVGFERIRRITGYLVGTMARVFNSKIRSDIPLGRLWPYFFASRKNILTIVIYSIVFRVCLCYNTYI